MSHRPSNLPYPQGRNSTIKQQEEQHHNNNLQNDSSISLREGTDVHYYDLNYSDEHENNDIVSSSDDEGREITHEEFIQMISTNMERKSKSSQKEEQESYWHHNQREYEDDQDEQQKQKEESIHYKERRVNPKKYPQSNNSKQQDYYYHHKKRFTPSTRDKSNNFYEYGQKNKNLQRNDPQKSYQAQKYNKKSKETSFNAQNSVNTVKQFRIDSFLNAHAVHHHKEKSKAWNQYQQMKPKPSEEDSQFSLITLPQYDEESSSLASLKKELKPMTQKRKEDQVKRLSKYKDIAKLQTPQENAYDKLNWRYQEAKLKFMDSFLPDSMKIGNSGYNMLKYMARKNDLTFNILKAL